MTLPRRLTRPKTLLTVIAFLFFAIFFALSVAKYRAFNDISFDLMRMMEAMWKTTLGRPLLMTSKGIPVSRLSEHVEIIFLLLAPVYRLFGDATPLLAVQAGLFALGAFPVYRLARRHLGSGRMGLALALTYLFYPVAQTAILFEFHGDTLAMPLLLFALDAAEGKRMHAYAIFIALALSCKVYVAVPVAVMGLVYVIRGRRQLGLATFVAGTLWFLIAFFGVRALFAPPEAPQVKATAAGYIVFYFGHIAQVLETWPARLINLIIVILPAILLSLRALPWLLPAASIIVPVQLSSGPGPVYSFQAHHYSLAVPFFIMAMIMGAARLRQAQEQDPGAKSGKEPWRRAALFTLLLTVFLSVILVDTPFNPNFYSPAGGSGKGLSPTGYLREARDRFKEDWVQAHIGDDERVVTDSMLGQRLLNRRFIYRTKPRFATLQDVLAQGDVVAVDALFDFALGGDFNIYAGGVSLEHDTVAAVMQDESWRLQNARDGLLLFSHESDGLRQEARRLEPDPAPQLLAQFGDQIGLRSFELTPIGPRRFRLTCEWVALQDLTQLPPLIAVSRPEGLHFSRIVHLPTIGLQPTTSWTAGTVVRESFDFELPADAPPGEYPLYVGWYRTDGIYSHYTDERTRLGAEVLLDSLQID